MKIENTYRFAVAIAAVAALLPLWMFGALASEGDSPGPLFFVPLAVGIVGVLIARFRPPGMARALFASALAQALVAAIAMIAWKQYLELSILNCLFMGLWIGSAMLFQKSARMGAVSATA